MKLKCYLLNGDCEREVFVGGKFWYGCFYSAEHSAQKGKEHTNTTGMNSDVSGPEFRCVFFHLRRSCFFYSTLFNSLLIFREKQSQSMHREVRTRAVGPKMLQAVER